MLTEAELQVD